MRIVLDTACLVTAVRSSAGAAGEVLRLIFNGELLLLLDLKLAVEYREVALRPEHLAVSKLTREEVLELIQALEAFAEPVKVSLKSRPLSPDPDDDMVLDLAINGLADALVTYNTKDFSSAGRRFGTPVLTPVQLLQTILKKRGINDGD